MYQPASTLTVDNANAALEVGLHAIEAGQSEIALSQVTGVDSSAVAVLLAWKRAAAARGAPLVFTGLSSSLLSLAELYGVTDLLRQH